MNRFNKLAAQFLNKTSLDAPTLCFDLGSSNTRMTKDGKLLYFDKTCFIKKKSSDYVVALGSSEAKLDESKNSQLELLCPIKHGKVTNVQDLSVFLTALISKHAQENSSLSLVRPKVYCALSGNFSPVQRDALHKCFKQAGAGSIAFVSASESVFELLRASQKKLSKIFMIDIGSETTNISFVSTGSLSIERRIEWGGDLFTEKVIDFVRIHHKALLCLASAEKIKREIAFLPSKKRAKDQSLELTVRAKDLISNLPSTVTVQSDDFKELFVELMQELIEVFELIFDQLDPQQLEYVSEHGLLLLGGGSQLTGIDDFLEESLGVPVTLAPHPDTVVIRGLERMRKQL